MVIRRTAPVAAPMYTQSFWVRVVSVKNRTFIAYAASGQNIQPTLSPSYGSINNRHNTKKHKEIILSTAGREGSRDRIMTSHESTVGNEGGRAFSSNLPSGWGRIGAGAPDAGL